MNASRSVPSRPDAIVVGAGAVGASVALHLARAGASVRVLEKEERPAAHQSGRNSGVVHAGYNLKPGTRKAEFCVEGNHRLRAWCRERGVPLVEGGILVVAVEEAEVSVLEELGRRSDANGVAARIVDAGELREIEPHAAGVAALHAPEGASLDPEAYVRSVLDAARDAGAEVRYGAEVVALEDAPGDGPGAALVTTTAGALEAGVAVACAGLQADRIAGDLAADVRVVPFRGFYAELRPERRDLVRSHVYRAPDLDFPFLGVHASRWTDGRVLLGPGAMLAPGRESYGLLGVSPRDLAETFAWPGFRALFSDPRFRRLAVREVRKNFDLGAIAREARALLPELRDRDLVRSFAGNRAQLVRRDGRLVDDFLVRETERCVHVLNAVSPGLTGSLPFGEWVAGRALARLGGAPAGGP